MSETVETIEICHDTDNEFRINIDVHLELDPAGHVEEISILSVIPQGFNGFMDEVHAGLDLLNYKYSDNFKR